MCQEEYPWLLIVGNGYYRPECCSGAGEVGDLRHVIRRINLMLNKKSSLPGNKILLVYPEGGIFL